MTLKRLESGEIHFGEAKWTAWGTIDCVVQMEETGEIIPYPATPHDEEEYGQELWKLLAQKYKHKVAPISEEEKYEAWANAVRADRSARIKSTDWTQLPDVPEATRTLWAEYRQALRDVTSQEGFPYEVVWPELPN